MQATELERVIYDHARNFVMSPLSYQFTERETATISRFFTNMNGRVFFIHTLPESIIAVLLAMYSRLKNPRGIRGVFADNLLPQMLGSLTRECEERCNNEVERFLKERGIKNLDQFIEYSGETKSLFNEFMHKIYVDPDFLTQLASAEKLRKFLSNWLDKYGHNSIARTATVHIGFEGISILAAKSIEWTRPGAGYIELSTRYVDMSGKDLYPIENEFRIAGVPEETCKNVASESQRCFEIYKELEGNGYDGPLPRFLAEQYGDVVPAEKLKQGVIGEVCDLLGNLLPCSTLTSLGGSFSGESLPSLIQHLRMDMLPETAAIADAVIAESEKIGANQFLRHLEVTAWQEDGWRYLTSPSYEPGQIVADLPPLDYVEQVFIRAFNKRDHAPLIKSMKDVVGHLTSMERNEHDKLPREFEAISVVFYGQMSFRGHRDLQRMGFCAHKRGYVSSLNGFYEYTKPTPGCLTEAFEEVMMMNYNLEMILRDALADKNLTSEKALMQYPLALGNNVPFSMAGNLRQMEFCNWQRSKPSVNHEVREVFLSFERKLREAYPWWEKISRADTTPAYVFARGDSDIPLSKVS